MRARKRQGPATRGNAPAGPGMLSVADGCISRPNRGHGQPSDIIADPAVVIVIKVQPLASPPGCYEALLGNECIVAQSRTPFCDAARKLLDLGLHNASMLVMRRLGSAAECLRAPIGVAAEMTVEESAFGPVFRRHRMGPPTAVEGARTLSSVGATT
jgi:hypothetical protein